MSGLLAELMRVRPYGGSLVAQTVKHLPTMRETPVRSLGQEDPLEKKRATHSNILAWWATVHGVAKSQTRLSDFHSHIAT